MSAVLTVRPPELICFLGWPDLGASSPASLLQSRR